MKRVLRRSNHAGTGPCTDADEPNTARVQERSATPSSSKRIVMTTDGSADEDTEAARQGAPGASGRPRSGMKACPPLQGEPRPRPAKSRIDRDQGQPAAMEAPKRRVTRGQSTESARTESSRTGGSEAAPKMAGGATAADRRSTASSATVDGTRQCSIKVRRPPARRQEIASKRTAPLRTRMARLVSSRSGVSGLRARWASRAATISAREQERRAEIA